MLHTRERKHCNIIQIWNHVVLSSVRLLLFLYASHLGVAHATLTLEGTPILYEFAPLASPWQVGQALLFPALNRLSKIIPPQGASA